MLSQYRRCPCVVKSNHGFSLLWCGGSFPRSFIDILESWKTVKIPEVLRQPKSPWMHVLPGGLLFRYISQWQTKSGNLGLCLAFLTSFPSKQREKDKRCRGRLSLLTSMGFSLGGVKGGARRTSSRRCCRGKGQEEPQREATKSRSSPISWISAINQPVSNPTVARSWVLILVGTPRTLKTISAPDTQSGWILTKQWRSHLLKVLTKVSLE